MSNPSRRWDGKRKLRIALVTSSYNYIRDGVAVTLNRLVGYLLDHGVDVLIFAPVAQMPAFAHAGTVVPVPSIPLPERPEYRLALGLPNRLKRRIAEFDPDILHIAVPDILGHAALAYGRKRGIPTVASYHTRYETYFRHYWFAPLRHFAARKLRDFYGACREVYVPSPSMAESLIADGLRDNFKMFMRGVDRERFSPSHRSMAWRERHGIGTNEVAVAFVGRLVREKQLDVLAAIYHRLTAGGLNYRAIIVGDGPERSGLERSLPDARFVGFLTGDELATAYASSDVFLFPSDTESFGNVTLEAMASGLPAVCANATGSRSLVLHGETGFLSPPGDADAFAAHVAMLIQDEDLRRRMGAAARTRSADFSWDEVLSAMLGYYQDLARAR